MWHHAVAGWHSLGEKGLSVVGSHGFSAVCRAVWGWSRSEGEERGLAGMQDVGQNPEREMQRLGKGRNRR